VLQNQKTLLVFMTASLLQGCATSPFDSQNVQRLLTYEEHSILNKAYQASPCDDSVYTPLLLSIQDRHWRPKQQKDSMCDLVKSIRWVDSNNCDSTVSRTTIEEEFKLFYSAPLQEVCYKAGKRGAITTVETSGNNSFNQSMQSKHTLVQLMDAASKCDTVRFYFSELTNNDTLSIDDYQKMSAAVDQCTQKKP
jgi:hypothetical protein